MQDAASQPAQCRSLLPRTRSALLPTSQLLRLLLLLLAPLWLSVVADGLGLTEAMPSVLSSWRRAVPEPNSPVLTPGLGWQERAYLAANPDVAAAVRDKRISSGYAHYIQQGRNEGRRGGFKEEAAPPPPVSLATVPSAPVPATKPVLQDTAAEAAPVVRAEPNLEILRPGTKPAFEVSAKLQAAAPAFQRRVERIRSANGRDGIRVVLDLDREPRFETPVRRSDGRLEVTLPGTLWQATQSGRLPATVLGYNTERYGTGTRLLLSYEDSRDGKGQGGTVRLLAVSTLPPDKERGHRLLIDVVLASTTKKGP
ncbi:MAG TPA: hypothetical protein VD995_33015 [Azospirillum sp.]|nr:hypothetical protein [Azospirillum sp.]